MQSARFKIAIVLICLNMLSVNFIQVKAQNLKDIESGRVSLPNGWKLTPVGKMLPVGDLPLNIAVSPSGKMLAITNNGQSDQSIHLVDTEKMQLLDSVIIAKGWVLLFQKTGNICTLQAEMTTGSCDTR
jgi:DNA-binding beta-propeller fold protein YncE